MPEKVTKRERVMNLLALLFASRRPIPFSEIAGRVIGYDDKAPFETLEKRFDRDRAELRAIGVSIDYVGSIEGGPGGYVVRRDEVFNRPITLDPDESALLAIAGRVGAAAVGDGTLHEALKGALRKLAVDVPHADAAAEAHQVTVLRAQSGDPRSRDLVAALAEAIGQERRQRFSYLGWNDDREKVRTVSPYGLGMFRGAWYLVGHDHDRNAIRCFKLSRFRSGSADDAGAGRPADAIPEDFVITDHIPTEADAPCAKPVRVTVLLRGHPDRANLLPGKVHGVEAHPDGTATAVIETARPWALLSAALSSFGDVVIQEPPDLREAVRRAAAARLGFHGVEAGVS